MAAVPAHAFVYWANFSGGSGSTIGRAGADGSGATQGFITGADAPSGVAVDGGHVYWVNEGTNSIGRANLDGSGADGSFITGAIDPFGVAVDGAHVYWTNVGTNSIGRANLDGSGPDNNFITGASDPEGIAVDGQHIYWANAFSDFIGRANLDGSGVDERFILESNSPRGVAVDAGHIYWTNDVDGTIGRANLDGGGLDNNFIIGASDPIGIAVDTQHVYWSNASGNSLSRADLDGSAVVPNLVAASGPYGVAVDAAASALGAPGVAGERVLALGSGSATVGALVDPNGGPTSYHVEWGTTAGYGSVGPDLPTGAPLTGHGDQAVAGQLTGLAPGTTYHWRIVATNSAGATAGTDQTLTTSAGGPTPTATFTITPPPVSGARTVISAAGSSGNGSSIVSYAWDWTGDGTVDATCGASDPVAMPVFMQTGTYHVGLQVTSADGQSAFASSTVTVSHVPTGAAPGVGLVAGYGCGSLIHNAVCTDHIEWDLIVADALDNGCFTEVPVDPWTTGTTICKICARDGADSEPVAYAPPPVAGWFHRTDAKTWQATGRVLVNGVIITPLTQLVGVGGSQGRHFEQQQTSVLINEVDDSIYAASADVAVKGTGRFPATPLERGAKIFAKLPVSAAVPPVLLGAGDRPGLVRAWSPRPRPDGDPQNVNPCEDPGVQGLPDLAQFNDPASVGSKISGFALSGPDPVTVHVVDGHVVVCVDVELPPATFGPCLSGDPFVLKATLVADENGLVLQDLHAHLPCAVIAGVVFEDVFFDYDAADQQWSAQGTVEAVPGIALHGQIEFAGGVFQHASVGLGNQTVPVAPWQVTEAQLDVYPDRTDGTIRLSLWPPIPGLNVSLLDITGGFTAAWGANPPFFKVTGDASTLGVDIAQGWLTYQPTLGEVMLHAELHKDLLGVLSLDATLDGGIWHLDPPRFNLMASANISVFDFVNVGGDALVSDNGIGACIGLGVWKFKVQLGGWISWSDLKWHPAFAGCDISDAADAQASADVSRADGRAAAGFTVPVTRGTRDEVIGVTGEGAPPAVALAGPHGRRLIAPTDHPVSGARDVVLHDPRTSTTFVIIHAPAAGRWTITPLAGSVPITAVRYATRLPDVSIRARVTGTGHRRAVIYRIRRIRGQIVMLFERGRGWERPIGHVVGGGSGRIAFAPASVRGGRREIVAEVEQYGRPRAERVVASYTAPPPAPLGRPVGLVAVRRGTSLIARWRAVPGAMAYLLVVAAGKGHRITTVVRGHRFTFRGISAATPASITVTALDSRRRSTRAALHVGPAKNRRRSQ